MQNLHRFYPYRISFIPLSKFCFYVILFTAKSRYLLINIAYYINVLYTWTYMYLKEEKTHCFTVSIKCAIQLDQAVTVISDSWWHWWYLWGFFPSFETLHKKNIKWRHLWTFLTSSTELSILLFELQYVW